MLKIKQQLPFNSTTIDETEYNKNQDDIKNSIKKLYIANQSKKKTIDEYAQLTTQIREEYAKLQAKCVQLENTIQKYKDYVENRWQQPRQQMRKRPLRKTKTPYYQFDNEYYEGDNGYTSADEQDNNDDYFTYDSKSKPKRKKRIVYFDEIDGDETNEPEEIEVVEEEPEVYVKVVKKKTPILRIKNLKKDLTKRVGITKSI